MFSISEKTLFYLRKTKILLLLLFVVVFSLIYMFLDDKHFSGVNVIKETIKKQAMKRK